MSSILDQLQQSLGPNEINEISQQLGATPDQTQTAVSAALPMLLGGMARSHADPANTFDLEHATQPAALGGLGGLLGGGSGASGGLGGGLAGALGGALGGGGGGAGGGLGGLLGGVLAGAAGAGGGAGGGLGGLLGSIFGGAQPQVEQGVGQASGLNGQQVQRLLMILGPVVLAMLARKRQQDNLDRDQLGRAAQQSQVEAQQHAERQNPQLGGLLGKIMQHVGHV